MTVKKNISLGLEEMRLSREEIHTKVKQVLEKVQLSEYIDRYPSELSGGQQQRVAVARMIAAEPGIFLMDEPLSNLDAMLRIDMRAELKRLHHELGATTVYVTHDQIEALTLSDKIAVMDDGLLRQLGTPEEIYTMPADLFVARFVGSPRINVIQGELSSDNGTTFFVSGHLKLEIVQNIDIQGKQIVATIRPEDIVISREEMNGWLKTRTYSVLPAGSETILTLESNALSFAVKINGFTDIRMDDLVWLNLDPQKMNYYDPHTEQLISKK
jgi:multiple sugar transport system ATP-binding protein